MTDITPAERRALSDAIDRALAANPTPFIAFGGIDEDRVLPLYGDGAA